MSAYLTLAEFKTESSMANQAIDELESIAPGFIDRQIIAASGYIDSRLSKRYDAPFAAPYPDAVRRWLAVLVTRVAYKKRGVDPNDPIWIDVVAEATTAQAEIKEAADSEEGLFELPLRADTSTTGITRGGPLGYSEQSPFVWKDEQRRIGRGEDRNGRGTRNG